MVALSELGAGATCFCWECAEERAHTNCVIFKSALAKLRTINKQNEKKIKGLSDLCAFYEKYTGNFLICTECSAWQRLMM